MGVFVVVVSAHSCILFFCILVCFHKYLSAKVAPDAFSVKTSLLLVKFDPAAERPTCLCHFPDKEMLLFLL